MALAWHRCPFGACVAAFNGQHGPRPRQRGPRMRVFCAGHYHRDMASHKLIPGQLRHETFSTRAGESAHSGA